MGGKGGGGCQTYTVGYQYSVGMHMALCHGPVDAALAINVGGYPAWAGQATANARIRINEPDLFGGKGKEGGISGDIDLLFGAADQAANDYLQSKIGTVPAYRGVTSVVLRQVYVGNNPYIKPWAFLCRRTSTADEWYPVKSRIGNDMNPAHIIHECLTNQEWGMGYTAADLDAAFSATADTLFSEGFGLSIVWDQATDIEGFIREILRHIEGVLYIEPTTGKFVLKLIRQDYDLSAPPDQFGGGPALPELPYYSEGIAWSPDGRYLAMSHNDETGLVIINTTTWTVTATPALRGWPAYSCAWSPDGKWLAIGHRYAQGLTILDTTDWSIVAGTPSLSNEWGPPALAWSPDSRYLAAACYYEDFLTVIDSADWSLLPGLPTLPDMAFGIAWSPDGEYIALGVAVTPALIVVRTSDWTIVAGTPSFDASLSTGYGMACAFSADGEYLAFRRWSYETSLIVITTADWSMVPNVATIESPTWLGNPSWSPDGRWLAVPSNTWPYLHVLDTATWAIRADESIEAQDGCTCAAWSPASKYLAAADYGWPIGMTVLEVGANPAYVQTIGPDTVLEVQDYSRRAQAELVNTVVLSYLENRATAWWEEVELPNLFAGGFTWFSPDGKYVATVNSNRDALRVLDATDFAVIGEWATPDGFAMSHQHTGPTPWLPDSSELTFSRYVNNSARVVSLDIATWSLTERDLGDYLISGFQAFSADSTRMLWDGQHIVARNPWRVVDTIPYSPPYQPCGWGLGLSLWSVYHQAGRWVTGATFGAVEGDPVALLRQYRASPWLTLDDPEAPRYGEEWCQFRTSKVDLPLSDHDSIVLSGGSNLEKTPDGNSIVVTYTETLMPEEAKVHRLCVVRLNRDAAVFGFKPNSRITKSTTTPYQLSRISISPTGRWLAGTTFYAPHKLVIYDTSDYSITLTRDLAFLCQHHTWSRDGRYLVLNGSTATLIIEVPATPGDDIEQSITLHNLGLINQMGEVVSHEVSFPGIPQPSLANRVAARELKNLSAELSSATLVCNRKASRLRAGAPIQLTWPEYGISGEIMRVAEIDYGTLTDGRITVKAVQDVAGTALSLYADPVSTAWTDPVTPPVAAPYRLLVEAPYWYWVQRLGESETVWADIDPSAGRLLYLAAKPAGDVEDYSLLTRLDDSDAGFAPRPPVKSFAPCAVLSTDLDKTTTTLIVQDPTDLDQIPVGIYAYLGDEIVGVDQLDIETLDVVLIRGIFDTTPTAHLAGTRIWFGSSHQASDDIEYYPNEVAQAKALPRTSKGSLSEGLAPIDDLTFANRMIRPYPPGKFLVNAATYPADIHGPLAVSWAHRDRLQQTAYFVEQSEGNIGPEAGTTYTIKIYGETGALIRTYTGETGTGKTYPLADEITDSGLAGGRPNEQLRVTITAIRDTYESWQSQDHTTECRGYGMLYGESYGE